MKPNHNSEVNLCPLCKSESTIFYQFKKRLYHQCNNCNGIFVDPSLILDREAEQARYKEHNNDVNDKRFQKFVSPITSAVMRDYQPVHKGLDFGAGTAAVITKVLKDNSFQIQEYDPFFHNHPQLLNETYDYLTACEVIEHFHDPVKEFILLKKLMKPDARLYCMTFLFDEKIDFHNWNYKDDHTHVFIYHRKSIDWIKATIGFSDVRVEERLITFLK